MSYLSSNRKGNQSDLTGRSTEARQIRRSPRLAAQRADEKAAQQSRRSPRLAAQRADEKAAQQTSRSPRLAAQCADETAARQSVCADLKVC